MPLPVKRTQQLAALQQIPANIRNICILAHVDHGKTTLADALVASNGIISQRMAGKMRYMDSREDEQERGITMKSSAISLFYEEGKCQYLVNLIDSPGHVDFSSEVSTAVRLCDGAVVLIDVVEGVSPQTHAVLRQAWLENIRPVLVLNKFDRLISELRMSTLEAFLHLQQILVQVNLLTNQLYTSEAMEKTLVVPDQAEGEKTKQSYDWTYIEDEEEDKNIFFSPDQGNVIFASALDGWGFTISQFAEMWSSKLGVKQEVLQKTLWGDYYINMKAKHISKGAQCKGKKPLFVQLVLDSIWAVYEAIVEKRDSQMLEKIVKSMDLKVAPRDLLHKDPRIQLFAVFSQWLPVSDAVLSMVVNKLPSPLQISEERVKKLMCSQNQQFHSLPPQTKALKSDFLACSASEKAPVIVYISKMFPVEHKYLPRNRPKPLTQEELQKKAEIARQHYAENTGKAATDAAAEGEVGKTSQPVGAGDETKSVEEEYCFIAFARIFSGTVQRGQQLYILGPKHNPAIALDQYEKNDDTGHHAEVLYSGQHITSFVVNDLYMFMGRELEQLNCVPAGNVLGIGGLEQFVLKSATVSSSIACPAFTSMYFDATLILHVAVEPAFPGDMDQLVEGLRLLNQADPCVRVLVQETGEHVIITAGEVHLQRCVDDLKERYAKVAINVSKPIVPFRETIIPHPKVDRVNEVIQDQNLLSSSGRQLKGFENDEEVLGEGLVKIVTPDRRSVVQIRAMPLPRNVAECVVKHQETVKTLEALFADLTGQNSDFQSGFQAQEVIHEDLSNLYTELHTIFKLAGPPWIDAVDRIWSFGPKRSGPNLLINCIENYDRFSIWSGLNNRKASSLTLCSGELRANDSSIVAGFQMATQAGPICEEPMYGVCFFIEQWEDVHFDSTNPNSQIVKSENETGHDGNGDSLSLELKRAVNLKNEGTSESELLVDISEETSMTKKNKDVFGPVSGQLMSVVKEGCRKAFQTMPQRLMMAMYRCTIQANTDILGKLYAVIGKRDGRVLSEELREGTQMFSIVAEFPVVESFGLAEEMRKWTSGLASPQLQFSHWEVLDIDPFWVPSTDEEYLHFGEKSDCENRARNYMNEVKRRKGLKVDEKIVEFAEKQRTLTRNK